MSSAVFYRDLRAAYPSVVSADGMYLRTDSGRRILDAVGGAGTVVLGHAVRGSPTCRPAWRRGQLHVRATFTKPWQEQLAKALVAMNRVSPAGCIRLRGLPGRRDRGEMARQITCNAAARRYKVIARWQSFHGSTLATLALSGRRPGGSRTCRCCRRPAHRAAYCYRCPLRHSHPACGVACADDLERRSCWRTGQHRRVHRRAGHRLDGDRRGPGPGVLPADPRHLRGTRCCSSRRGADWVRRTGRRLAIEHWASSQTSWSWARGSAAATSRSARCWPRRGWSTRSPRAPARSATGHLQRQAVCTFVGLQVLRSRSPTSCSMRWRTKAGSSARCSGSWPAGGTHQHPQPLIGVSIISVSAIANTLGRPDKLP